MTNTLRIATRKSPMALWQAEFIQQQIKLQHPNINIELVGFVTKGDKDTTQALVNVGGKSVFVKELQHALLNNEADIAVHCIKDMSVQDVAGLHLGAVIKRDDPGDAFISNTFQSFDELPSGSVVGTSSPRRESLLKHLRDDIEIKLCRGNVNTRLKKLADGEFDAIILAIAGLERMGMLDLMKQRFDRDYFTPSIGQGALGIECRVDDELSHTIIQHLHHEPTAQCIHAERAVNKLLGGDCHSALGAYAQVNNDELSLHAMVASLDGKTLIRETGSGIINDVENIGFSVAKKLIEKGAKQLLNNDASK